MKAFRKRTDFTVNVEYADGSLGRKIINEPIEALKIAVRSVICLVTKSKSNAPMATWKRDGHCRDMAIDKAVKENIISFQLAGNIFW